MKNNYVKVLTKQYSWFFAKQNGRAESMEQLSSLRGLMNISVNSVYLCMIFQPSMYA